MTIAPVRVLVVHSDPADLAVLASVVAAHEFELRVLEQTTTLIADVARYQPDAIVLDVKQRERDGYELCSILKADPSTVGIPVILTTASTSVEARQLALAAGCDDFLEKPIHRHQLAHRLHSFARLRRAWLEKLFHVLDGGVDPQLADAYQRWLELKEQTHQIET
jgi:CheY-like chemotaxis protein